MALLLMCLVVSAAAQSGTGTKAAAIVLPRQVVAGQAATLAVLDAQGSLLPGAEVEFHGGVRVTTDSTGRATFTAPAQVGVLIAQAVGTAVKMSSTVLPPAANPPDGILVTEVPSIVSVHEPFSVAGAGFRGEAEGTRVWLGEQPALVLAASPVALVVQPGPRTPPGATQLIVEADGRRPAPAPLTLVALEITSEKKQLATKEKGRLTVLARGSEQRLEVEVRNLTPGVVKLPGGADVLRVTTRGGAENAAEVELEGRRVGDFSVSVRLVPPVAGLPDIEAARQKLIAARRLAPAGWGGRVEGLIEQIEKNPQDALKVRRKLEKMLGDKPEGEFGRLLEAAWKILLNR